MSFKKIVFLIAFLGIFAGGFFVNAQPAQAATVEELMALIAQLKAQILQLQAQLATTQGQPAAWCHDFNTNIRMGDSGDETHALQLALLKQGIFGESDETGDKTFGEQTASAVVGFQQKYASEILAPFGLKFGTGFVGKGTRAKLNALYGCGVTQPTAIVPAPTPTPTPTPTPIPQPVSPSITVVSPNGGEQIIAGSSSLVKVYCSQGVSKLLNIYLVYSDSNAITNIASGVTCRLGETSQYSWTVPSSLVSNARVQVETIDKSVSDISDNYFSIVSVSAALPDLVVPADTIIAPTSGVVDQDVSVVFTIVNQGGTVASPTVYSYTNQAGGFSTSHPLNTCTGSTALQPSASCVSAYKFRFSTPGIKYLEVKLDPSNQIQESNENNNTVGITLTINSVAAPSVTVLSPNGGESWAVGGTYLINWQSTGLDKVNIILWSGKTAGTYKSFSIASNINASSTNASGSYYLWVIPATTTVNSLQDSPRLYDYPYHKIEVVDSRYGYGSSIPVKYSDDSNSDFSIVSVAPFTVTFPSVAAILQQGSTYNLTWSGSDPGVTSYSVYLVGGSLGSAGSRYLGIAYTSQSSFSWTVPSDVATGSGYQIQFSGVGATGDNSDSFSIAVATTTPSITVLSPNGGESLAPGSATITWKSAGIPAGQPVNIISLVGVDGTEYHLRYDTPNDGSEQVILPTFEKSGSFKIKIETTANKQAVIDLSDNYFNIIPPASTPSITSFNYTETDAYSGSVQFYWTNSGTDSVNLWIPCYSGLTIKNAATGANFFCGESDLKLPSNSSIYLKFTNSSGSAINASAIVAPITSSATSVTIYSNYSKTINFSIVSAPIGLRNIEDQTASISDAVSRLLQSFEEFKKSNP